MEEEVFLVFKVNPEESRKIRKLIHEQEWYTGADVPISKRHDYYGMNTGSLRIALQDYWRRLKSSADRAKKEQETGNE